MKTVLPQSITTIEEAKQFLTNLFNNGEHFHPEDDATDLSEEYFTQEEGEQLNKLMADIYALEGNNNAMDMVFDPCGFILALVNPTETDQETRDYFYEREQRGLKSHEDTDVKKYLVEILYQSISGNPLAETQEVEAADSEAAMETVIAIVHKKKNFLKMHGGSAQLIK